MFRSTCSFQCVDLQCVSLEERHCQWRGLDLQHESFDLQRLLPALSLERVFSRAICALSVCCLHRTVVLWHSLPGLQCPCSACRPVLVPWSAGSERTRCSTCTIHVHMQVWAVELQCVLYLLEGSCRVRASTILTIEQ